MTASEMTTTPETTDEGPAEARYHAQLEAIDRHQQELQAKDRMFAKARAALFFLAALLLLVGYGIDGVPLVGWLGWATFATFFVVVVANEPVRDRLDEIRRHRAVILRLVARMERDWSHLATKRLTSELAAVELPQNQREAAVDLDLLGDASLFHLVSMTATSPGTRTLARWLTGPADEQQATSRAAAAQALAPRHEERLRFYTLARQVDESSGDPDRFVEWAVGDSWLDKRRWLWIWSNVSAVAAGLMLLAVLLSVVGVFSSTILKQALIGLFLLMLLNVLLTAIVLGQVHGIFAIALASRRAVDDYQELFSSARWLPKSESHQPGPESQGAGADGSREFLSSIRRTIVDGDRSAVEGMRRLKRIARAGGLRQSAATFFIYLPLQALVLWDVRVLRALENWKDECADVVGAWFHALGELESLMSIAALWDEYPQWSEATWSAVDEHLVLEATAIGHPLLKDNVRVCNDVQVGPPGTLLLVTGSNMSGKSTLLRSVGLNVALAGVGAPCCAAAFSLPSVELATSIRVSDDVSQGVSFYMAELKRLKTVVDRARELESDERRACLFLLDEILQGTNSRERQIAVVRVLRHLISSRAIGAISTHDLELADDDHLQLLAQTVHFRETIRPDASGTDQMTFDYVMRDGVSPTTNALRLLEMVGLDG